MATKVTTKCRRCDGTGIWAGRGECFGCNMSGTRTHTRYTKAEKNERATAKAREESAREAVYKFAATLDQDTEWSARYGFLDLRDSAPERFVKLLKSVESGRVADVTHALAHYYDNRIAN